MRPAFKSIPGNLAVAFTLSASTALTRHWSNIFCYYYNEQRHCYLVTPRDGIVIRLDRRKNLTHDYETYLV